MHDHRHAHGGSREQNKRRLVLALLLTLGYMAAEIVGGILSGSLALLADAGHMASDAAALALGWFAAWVAERPPTPIHSYGYYRAEILAALANAAALIAVSVFVFVEALSRLFAPRAVEGGWMMVIAIGGLAVNLVGLAILHPCRSDSLNVRGAWLHLLTDAMGSVAAIVAGAAVWMFAWYWADPVASILIGLLVIYSAWQLMKEAIAILMESTPKHIDIDSVRNALAGQEGVCGVHDLHVWTITSGMESLSAHVVLEQGRSSDAAIEEIREVMHERFGIHHVTIQIESQEARPCPRAM